MLATTDKRMEPMSRDHFLAVYRRLRDYDREANEKLSRTTLEAMVMRYRQNGSSWALVVGRETIAVGGVVVLWPGVGEAWMLTTPGVERYPQFLCRSAVTAIEAAVLTHGLHRVQVSVGCKNTRAIRFAIWLGFESEGICKAYGPDRQDYERLAWVAW